MAELSDNKRGEVIWAERLTGDTQDLLESQSSLLDALCAACAKALLNDLVQRTPGAARAATRQQRADARWALRSCTVPRRAICSAASSCWKRWCNATSAWPRHGPGWPSGHIMQVVQGLSGEPARDFKRAIDTADRALDLEPASSLAMAIKGPRAVPSGGRRGMRRVGCCWKPRRATRTIRWHGCTTACGRRCGARMKTRWAPRNRHCTSRLWIRRSTISR